MSDDRQQHLRSRLKHVSMNNWNYTEYIPVVHHDLANNSTITYATSGQDYFFFPNLTVRTMSFTNWGLHFVQFSIRRVWRYKRGNQNPYIEEEQTTQWPKEKVQKDKQRYTKHTYKAKVRVTRTPLKAEWTQVLRKGKQFLLH
jgi:hypothetical protein